MNVEGPWIDIAIPPDNIERMKIIIIVMEDTACENAHLIPPIFPMGLQSVRHPDIPFAVGSVLQKLTVFVAVTTWYFYRT